MYDEVETGRLYLGEYEYNSNRGNKQVRAGTLLDFGFVVDQVLLPLLFGAGQRVSHDGLFDGE